MTPPVRVLHDHHPRYTLGPLGCYEQGAKLTFKRPKNLDEEVTVIVMNIDFDGAAVAFDIEYLRKLKAKRIEIDGESEEQAHAGVVQWGQRMRSAPHPSVWHQDHERIQQEMDAQCRHNRAEYGTHAA